MISRVNKTFTSKNMATILLFNLDQKSTEEALKLKDIAERELERYFVLRLS